MFLSDLRFIVIHIKALLIPLLLQQIIPEFTFNSDDVVVTNFWFSSRQLVLCHYVTLFVFCLQNKNSGSVELKKYVDSSKQFQFHPNLF